MFLTGRMEEDRRANGADAVHAAGGVGGKEVRKRGSGEGEEEEEEERYAEGLEAGEGGE